MQEEHQNIKTAQKYFSKYFLVSRNIFIYVINIFSLHLKKSFGNDNKSKGTSQFLVFTVIFPVHLDDKF